MSKIPPAQIKAAATKVKKNPDKGALPVTPDTSVKTQTKPAVAANTKTTAAKAPVKSATKPVAKPAAKPIANTVAATKAASSSTATAKAKDNKKSDDKKPKPEKVKMERDSFTMPKDEYAQLTLLKSRLTALGQPAKKSELLRAGIKLLAAMSDNTLKTTLAKIPVIKTGRPNKKG